MSNKEVPGDDSGEISQRREKLKQLRECGSAFPNGFRRDALAADLLSEYGDREAEQFEGNSISVNVAGRLMSKRVMGKASFAHIQDVSGQIQLFVQRDNLPDGFYNQQFKKFDIGDIVGARGELFKTKTGELSVRVDEIQLLTKSLRPLPEKFHGLTDQEMRYRQRYVDLIVNEKARETFRTRTKIINFIRQFMIERGFLEVETPMMQSIPGGAVAKPFITHHNALDMRLYLRVAPELNLKRLVVGGFERVFEINRNFRNEGVSTQHNPEFTMLEFYQAYADYHEFMELTENMLRGAAQASLGNTRFEYQGETLDFSEPFRKLSVRDAVMEFNPDISNEQVDDLQQLRDIAKSKGAEIKSTDGLGKVQMAIFDKTVEHELRQPTFITGYPVEVSPLSRRNDDNAFISDRFELFIAGREIANGFSELNDPEDQAERFHHQVAEKDAGDDEAMHFDHDYIRALEYGLPPAAGEGVGIDRLVMLLTDSASIRDVLLFPYMRPEA